MSTIFTINYNMALSFEYRNVINNCCMYLGLQCTFLLCFLVRHHFEKKIKFSLTLILFFNFMYNTFDR